MKKSTKVIIYISVLLGLLLIVYVLLKLRLGKSPLIKHFRSSSIWKAFILNSIAASLIIFMALITKKEFDKTVTSNEKNSTKLLLDENKHDENKHDENKPTITTTTTTTTTTNILSIFLTLFTTFVTTMLAYTIMFVLFGYGGGMLAVGG